MNRQTARLLLVMLGLWAPLDAQEPAPGMAVTAEAEEWYAAREPILLGRNLYYPSGPLMHVNRNEMVQTGLLGGVPLYIRTTEEPRSIIYVPVSGGLMHPYERRRDGQLAGTVGSRPPTFPVGSPGAADPGSAESVRAPAPPTGVSVSTFGYTRGYTHDTEADSAASAAADPAVTGTAGALHLDRPPAGPTLFQTARRPLGLNDVFIEFDNARWFAAGPVVPFSADRFTPIGEHRGFIVYTAHDRSGTIFVPPFAGAPVVLTPYEAR